MKRTMFQWAAVPVCLSSASAYSQSNPTNFHSHARQATYWVSDAMLNARDTYTATGASADLTGSTSLNSAESNIVQSQAIISNISNLGGFASPAPQGISDPIASAKSAIVNAIASLTNAQQAFSSISSSNASLARLLNTDIPNATASLQSAQSDLNAMTNPVSLPSIAVQNILASLYSGDFWLSSAMSEFLADAQENSASASSDMVQMWQTTGWPRNLVSIAIAVEAGVPPDGQYVPTASDPGGDNYSFATQAKLAVAYMLINPAVSPHDHGLPYFYRTGTSQAAPGVKSQHILNAVELYVPRAWSDTDQAGWLILGD